MTARDLLRRFVDALLPLEDGRVEPLHGAWEFDRYLRDSVDGKEWAGLLGTLRTEAQALLATEDPAVRAGGALMGCTCRAGELWTAGKTDPACPMHGQRDAVEIMPYLDGLAQRHPEAAAAVAELRTALEFGEVYDGCATVRQALPAEDPQGGEVWRCEECGAEIEPQYIEVRCWSYRVHQRPNQSHPSYCGPVVKVEPAPEPDWWCCSADYPEHVEGCPNKIKDGRGGEG